MNNEDVEVSENGDPRRSIGKNFDGSPENVGSDHADNARKNVVTGAAQIVQQRTFAGPFPPPEMIDDYERHHPGFLKDLMERSYEAQRHEQALDLIQVNGPLQYAKRGQFFGLIIVVGSIIGVCVCAYFNQSVAATMLSITGLSPIIGHLIKNPLLSFKADQNVVDKNKPNTKSPTKLPKKRG